MEFKNYGKADTNDGLIPHQDLMGLHEFTDDGNNPIEPFEDFRGRGAARRKAKKDQKQARKVERMNIRQQGRLAKKQASPIGRAIKKSQDNRSKKLDVNKQNAKANIIAAKNAGKDDPSVSALLSQQTSEPEKKSNTGLYIGIGVGILALAVGAYLVIKKPWKKK